MYRLKDKEKQLKSHILDVLAQCRDALNRVSAGAKLVLYGSYAAGLATRESDLDLLILVADKLTAEKKKQIRDCLYEISLENDIVISALIKSSSAWEMPITKATPIYNNIQHYGIAI
ncbi:MAG: hypothetical protein CVV39_07600 [Planctomycetes bacterium HGW-Planctomycetes-1]|nr:MAG: hypothetical protein CVV39_07600 [Planctomycetes bacterium HGW-Planctomycetes-1]